MKPRKVGGLEPSGSLRSNAARIVAARLEELTDLAAEALEPAAATAQHDMRIAAKRLRYVLEITGGCLGPEAEALRDGAKRLQGVLGEIHDCDVMLPRVAGVESAEALLRTRRELLFARFRELWSAEETRAAVGAFERRAA
jgi:CHAD domain-containing protein